MKRIFIIIFLLWGCETYGVEASSSPVRLKLFSFCTTLKVCEISATLSNETPYSVEMKSLDFQSGLMKLDGIQVFNAEKYALLEMHNKNVYEALVPNVYPRKNEKITGLSLENTIKLKPNEKLTFKLKNIENSFNFNVQEVYILIFYSPFVSFYIDGEYIGTRSFESNFSELRVPHDVTRPK